MTNWNDPQTVAVISEAHLDATGDDCASLAEIKRWHEENYPEDYEEQ